MRFWIKIGTRYANYGGFDDFALVIVINVITVTYNVGLLRTNRRESPLLTGELKSHLNPDAAETNKLKHM